MKSKTSADRRNDSGVQASEAVVRRLLLRQPAIYVGSFSIAVLLFVVDVMILRGTTAAIGYCVIPVLAAGARRRDFSVAMTIACMALTWAAFSWSRKDHWPGCPYSSEQW